MLIVILRSPKVGEYSHNLSKLFLRDLNEQHFLTPMKHLAQVLPAMLSQLMSFTI